MHKYRVELLPTAWAELDEIAEVHLQLVGPDSAQKVTDNTNTHLKSS